MNKTYRESVMKKLAMLLIIGCCVTPLAQAKTSTPKLPFVGTKVVSMSGAASREETIQIKKDGTTVVQWRYQNYIDTMYKGKYQPLIPLKDGEGYYRIKGNSLEWLGTDKAVVVKFN